MYIIILTLFQIINLKVNCQIDIPEISENAIRIIAFGNITENKS